MKLANRLAGVKAGESMVIAARAQALAAQGHQPISLAMGEPSFDTPMHAVEAAHAAALSGDTKYPPASGTARMREAVRTKFSRDNGLSYDADEVIIGNGSKQLMLSAFMATCNPGDEIIIPRPGYMAYDPFVHMAECVPVYWSCSEERGFIPSAAELESLITERTRWVIINHPSNPTGAVCTKADLTSYAEVLLRHPDVLVISDDMYEHMIYSEEGFHTIARVEQRLKERVMTVNGVSKSYGMTGWRVGYAGGSRELIDALNTLLGYWTGGVGTINQAAAIAAIEGPQELIAERREIYRRHRDYVLEALREIPQISCHMPDGAFYLYPNIQKCLNTVTPKGRKIATDSDFTAALFDEKMVAMVPGSAYGLSPYARISYATSMDNLREGMSRLSDFCASLEPK